MVGASAVRPELISRLARVYYHADSAAINETSVRGEDGVWRYRDTRRPRRVYNAVVRAELTRVRPSELPAARSAGAWRVTLCADEVLSSFGDNGDHQPAAAHA